MAGMKETQLSAEIELLETDTKKKWTQLSSLFTSQKQNNF